MTFASIGGSGIDTDALADLHFEVLPTSMVSRLGRGYCRRFYRYCAASKLEHVMTVVRDGRLAGGAMISLRPDTLTGRLVRHTSLIFAALLNFWRVPWLSVISPGPREPSPGASEPELIELLVSSRHQGSGIGTELLGEIEAWLRRKGVSCYHVKTFADITHPAARFYIRNGFRVAGTKRISGTDFTLLDKTLTES